MVCGLTGLIRSVPFLSLGRVDFALARLDQPHLLELFKALVELRQDGAARRRDDDVLGELPAELLRDFEAVGLRPLGVVGPEIHVDERPAVLVGDLAAQPVDVVIVALDRDGFRAVDRRADDLSLLQPFGDEDVAVEPRLGGVGGDGVGEIAGRGAGDGVEAELDRLGDRHRDDPVFVGESRVVDRVVLDVELLDAERVAQPVRAHQRRKAGIEAGLRLAVDRQ